MEMAQLEHLLPFKANRQEVWRDLMRRIEEAQARGIDPHADPMVGHLASRLRGVNADVAAAQAGAGLPVPEMPTNLQGPWEALIDRGVPDTAARDPIRLAIEELRRRAAQADIRTVR